VYDPVVAESRLGGDKTESVVQPKDFGIENLVENLFLMTVLLKMLKKVMRMNQFCGSKGLF